jgi:hypothetical protein
MKIIANNALSDLAEELYDYCFIDALLKDNKIPCISQCVNEFYHGDDKKMFEFGHKYWNKSVISFYDQEYVYFAVGDLKTIKQILQKELKEIKEEDKD